MGVELAFHEPSLTARMMPPGLTAADGALDLLPIAAVLVGRIDGRFLFEATNRAFRRAGLGVEVDRSILIEDMGARIAAFLDADGSREEHDWIVGGTVETRYYRVTFARLRNRNEPRVLVSIVDRTAEVRTERNLRREMATDSLTGLPNRAGFTDRLEALIEADRDRVAVLMLDLDRFARVNSCLGSLAGDELLITVARRLKGALRASDLLARTGGDEFGILLTLDGDATEADFAADRIRAALATPFRLSDYEIRVSCSIGLAHAAEADGDAEDVIRHAQFAVKRSKKSGRAEAYHTQAFDHAREQFSLETSLRRAIEAGELALFYQPVCDLNTGRISAFEALARWTDEDGQIISPDRFIPVAEESGLIVPLGRWAVNEALRTLAQWDERAGGDCGVRVAVNLSPIQLQRDSIAQVVEEALAAAGVAGERLKLELTESALIADPDGIAETLHALKALGTMLAMDDFGTGYSNLAYLQRLPIDILKIDRSFVTDMLADRDKVAIVRAVLSLAQALGMETVAEGIETVELGQTLAALGCNYGQGWAYARALDPDAAYRLLVERNA